MTHRFDITKSLLSLIGYKGTFYPGIFANQTFSPAPGITQIGREIKKTDINGNVIFMPVKVDGIELPNAVISITGKKTIVETPLVGGRGTVKELISMDDFEVSIAGVLVSNDGRYPELLVEKFRDIWQKNESVTLVSAISDMILLDTQKVVLKTVSFPPVGSFENAQIVTLTAVSDYPFTLTIE